MTDTPSNNRPLRLVTNADVQRLIESRENASGFVTMLHPLELFMPKDLLETLTRGSLASIREQRKENESPNEALAAARAIQQRVDFIAWLTGQPESIYMAIYPAEMDGLDELDELADLLEDENPPTDLF